MQLSHRWSAARPVFDDENLVSCAGLVPVMELGEQAGLSELLTAKVSITTTNVASAGVNPAGEDHLDRGRDGCRRGLHR